ncbi:hypothetical protein SAVIM338S_05262 [Streptomyces avidinii]
MAPKPMRLTSRSPSVQVPEAAAGGAGVVMVVGLPVVSEVMVGSEVMRE